jgi:hypothetical protein
LKNALLVDLDGTYDLIANLMPLRPERYSLTVASSWFDALALVTEREYDLIIFRPLNRCSNSTWSLVLQLSQHSLADAVVMVHAEQPDSDFYAQAAEFGAVVLSSPAGFMAVPSTRDVGTWGVGLA